MADLIALHRRAVGEFGDRLAAVRPDQWTAPTPCSEWDVRALANHLIGEQLWVPPMLAGRTVADVGTAFDGDVAGDDPAATYATAARAAVDAFGEPDALTRTVHLSFGDFPGQDYLEQLTADLVVHSWDLARATGGAERLDPDLVHWALTWVEGVADLLAGSGLFGPVVSVPPDADEQTRLLALTGRRA